MTTSDGHRTGGKILVVASPPIVPAEFPPKKEPKNTKNIRPSTHLVTTTTRNCDTVNPTSAASNDGNAMPRVLNLRALCAKCEKAEAKAWSVHNRTPLCQQCADGQTTEPVPIISSTVVTALCSQCGLAPASLLTIDKTALCEICASGKKEVVPLRETDACGGIVFDKMDFSGLQGKGVICDTVQGGRVDLSYYKTKVPQSLVGERKRASESVKSSSSTLRRRRR